LVGTIGQGIFRFRRDERRRPRITFLDARRSPDNSVNFRWDGRDFKNETPPAELRFRTRIDDQPWTAFRPTRTRTVRRLEPGELLPALQAPAAREALEDLKKGKEVALEGLPVGPQGERKAEGRGYPILSVPGNPATGAVLLLWEVTGVRQSLELRERARRLA